MKPLQTTTALVGAALLSAVAVHPAVGQQASASHERTPVAPHAQPASATVPFTLDHNRMMVEIELVRADGIGRAALAWVDTGNEGLILGEKLARDLSLDLASLEHASAQHSIEIAAPSPRIRVGGLELAVEGVKTRVHPGTAARPGVTAEVCLPASALRRHHVVFDYPARRLTVARPGVLKPRGAAIPCRVNEVTGLFLVAATLDGETVQLGIDTGSAGTWVSTSLTSAWLARHQDWRHAIGGVGSTNFFGFGFEVKGVLMRLPELTLGPLRVTDVALLGLDPTMFEWYSKKSAGSVAGFLGANVLKRFRLEVDYPNRMTYWHAGRLSEPNDLDIVGLTIRAEADGGYTIAGITTRDGTPTVDGVEPGDTLISVGPLTATKAPMGEVVAALRGKPGESRTLVVDRAGTRHTVEAKVTRLP